MSVLAFHFFFSFSKEFYEKKTPWCLVNEKALVDVCGRWVNLLLFFSIVNPFIDIDASSPKGTSPFLLFYCEDSLYSRDHLHQTPSFLLSFSFSLQPDRPNSLFITHCFSHSLKKFTRKDRMSPCHRPLRGF